MYLVWPNTFLSICSIQAEAVFGVEHFDQYQDPGLGSPNRKHRENGILQKVLRMV